LLTRKNIVRNGGEEKTSEWIVLKKIQYFRKKKERFEKKALEISWDFLYNAICCDLDSVEA